MASVGFAGIIAPECSSISATFHCNGLVLLEKLRARLSHLAVIRTFKRTGAILLALMALAGVVLAAAFSVFTFWLLPNLDHYRPELERQLSSKTGRAVQIKRLSGAWEGIAPRLDLSGLTIANRNGGVPLTLQTVSVKPSWLSLLNREWRLADVVLESPFIELRRDTHGTVFLNGFDLTSGPSDSSTSNWLLRQPHIEIRNARLGWQDDRIGLPRLDLSHGHVELSNGLLGHSLKLSGVPVATLGKGFDLDASWRGDDVSQWRRWSGSLKVALNGARAGLWSRYLQQAGLLRSGEGNGSVNMSFADGQLDTLDANVSVRNAAYTPPNASELVLPHIEGELKLARTQGHTYQINASNLTLASASGLAFDKSNIKGQWTTGTQGRGQLTLDNVTVQHLMPFLRALGLDKNPLFAHFAPQGALKNLTLGWQGAWDAPRAFVVQTSFEQLARQPFGSVPGVSGVSGSIRFDQNGGQLRLDNHASTVNYPTVFPQPLPFTALTADVQWHRQGDQVKVDFHDVQFANTDLTGWFKGSYQFIPGKAGVADMHAGIESVRANRVPAYLPHAVGQHTLQWLKDALKAGLARQVDLSLKGDLDKFPFVGGKGGDFRVDAKVEQAVLQYQKGWPNIDNIDAQLSFHNERMEITSQRASTLGVPLNAVVAKIDNLGAAVPRLSVNGKAADSLSRMLAFTGKSPVDGWLSGFTSRIGATGPATLDLALQIPLAGSDKVTVKGDIHLLDNQLIFRNLPTPVVNHARGTLTFTERGVESSGIQIKAFGGNFTLKAATPASGRINFDIAGDADSNQVMRQYLPWLQPYVTGRSNYAVQFTIQHGLENLTVASSLQGTAVHAPSPVGKLAEQAAPLQLQLHPGKPGNALQLAFTVGSSASGLAEIVSARRFAGGRCGDRPTSWRATHPGAVATSAGAQRTVGRMGRFGAKSR
ncbi:YhdP family protein [Paludibacterium denitrificans]|uniref:TIGR02099 family protein n=1 Tax=Paludibacterium denitrificans TaxID=2675226 RepID=A0A844GE28_9NEIS|nr:TIGR02099 family protein [Paludibacterium denitrificans]